MKICIVDDHALITDAIQRRLSEISEISEIALFNDPVFFSKSISINSHPDILIIDLIMPSLGGYELIEQCKSLLKDEIKIIVLSCINNAPTVRHTLRLGVHGYLAKDSTMEELTAAVYEVMEGGKYISKSVQKSLMNSIVTEEQIVFYLTPREKDVLQLLCSGHAVKEICYELKLSINTVHSYRKNIFRKFKVTRTVDLVAFAMLHGLYNP